MIKQIHIKNYILIEELVVKFDKGLNVITGETGAGKSIVLQAIDLIFAPRVSKDIIKSGEDKALIELTLDASKKELAKLFDEYGVDDLGGEIIISKEVSQNSLRTRVNGSLVNVEFVSKLRELFIDIHSQNQTYSFLQPKSHIFLLDSYAKDTISPLLAEYSTFYAEYKKLQAELDDAKKLSDATEGQIDFLKFQVHEIEAAEIEDANEYEELKQELSILENSEKLKELTGAAHWSLNQDDNSIISALGQIKASISKAASMDDSLLEYEERIIDANEILTDISSGLRNYYENLDNDTSRLNAIQERIFLLDKLIRKYGGSLDEVLNTYEKLDKELSQITHSTEHIQELENKIVSLFEKLTSLAGVISEKRKDASISLSQSIVEKLEKLELPRARFDVSIEHCDINSKGFDKVEFLISTNVSEELKPLAKVASGGEVSRVVLALKTIFASNDEINTVIFDEIDTGISGKTSQSVADEISELSSSHQVILITHQAIIASKADKHFYVKKIQGSEKTQVGFYVLEGENKIKALAELASGDINAQSMEFARNLLVKA